MRRGLAVGLPLLKGKRAGKFVEGVLVVGTEAERRAAFIILAHAGVDRVDAVAASAAVAVGADIVVGAGVLDALLLVPALRGGICGKGPLGAAAGGEARAAFVVARVRRDVHDAGDRAVTVEDGAGPAQNLHARHVGKRHAHEVRGHEVHVVQFLAVDNDLDAAEGVFAEAAHGDF